MKKVLIIAYYYPPRPFIGAQRPYRLAKYFLHYGWEPIILTPKLPGAPPPNIKVFETEYKDIIGCLKSKVGLDPALGTHEQLGLGDACDQTWKSQIIQRASEILAFPDMQRGWYGHAIKRGSEIINEEGIDCIISTSPPVTSHLIARKLKELHGKVWVADFRDLWTQNHYYSKMALVKIIEKYLEVKTIGKTDALVTVSVPLADKLKSLHKGKLVYSVTNGYDPDELIYKTNNSNNKCTITYTGNMYNHKRTPSLLFRSLYELIQEGYIKKNTFEIQFYTPRNRYLISEIKKYNLEEIVQQYDFIPREEVLQKQRDSKLLLLLLWDDKNEKGVYTGKIFEYLAAGRPIIAVGGPGGVVKDLLEETNAGKHANDVIQLKNILMDYYKEYSLTGQIKSSANNNIDNYSYDNIAKKYTEILNRMIANN